MAGVFPPQGVSAAGGLTGVTEDGGTPNVVTVADALNVGSSTTDAASDGELAAGTLITNAINPTNDLIITNATGRDVVFANTGGLRFRGASSAIKIQLDGGIESGVGVLDLADTSLIRFASGSAAGGTPDVQLARNAAGRIGVSDPSGTAGARLDLLDSGGTVRAGVYETFQRLGLDGTTGIYFAVGAVNTMVLDASALEPANAGGIALGDAARPWGALTLGDAANEGSQSKAWTTTLTDGSATDLVTIAVADGQYAGGELVVAIYATDGTDDQIRVETVRFGAYNIGGTITADISATATADDALAVSTGTLTAAFTETSATNVLTLRLTATSSLTTTTLEARCHGVFLAGAQTVTPQ